MNRVVGLGLLVGASLLSSCSERGPAPPRKSKLAVKVETIEATRVSPTARYSGTLEPEARVDVAFRASGYIGALGSTGRGRDRRALDVGDFVTKGTVLARLSSGEYSQRVATARARHAEARASAKLADQELERTKKLYDSKVVSLAELEARTAQRDAARASEAAASAQTGEAAVALDDTVLRAPIDGVILARRVEEGSLVAPGSVGFVVADTRRVKVTFGAPQALVEQLDVGHDLRVDVGAPTSEEHRTIRAKITRIAPAADRAGRLFGVEALVPNPDGDLRPGSVVSVRLEDATDDGPRLVVPLSAIVRSDQDPRGFALFVIDGPDSSGAASRREVKVGGLVGNGVAVTSGVAVGDRVVTNGAGHLTDGADVVIVP